MVFMHMCIDCRVSNEVFCFCLYRKFQEELNFNKILLYLLEVQLSSNIFHCLPQKVGPLIHLYITPTTLK